MKIMKNYVLRIGAALLLVGTGSVVTAGCGGSSNGGSSVRDANGFVTRAEEDKYSTDALILASREATDAQIPTVTAVSTNGDLAVIRARYTALNDIKARPYDDLKSVIVQVRTGSPLGNAWAQGTTATGVADVDALLTQYKVDKVSTLTSGTTNSTFVVRFINPLNTKKVRESLADKIAPDTSGLVSVRTNGVIGDGNQITRTTTNSTRVYVFSKGWGDCTASCINRHNWTVTLDNSGTMNLEESGTPL